MDVSPRPNLLWRLFVILGIGSLGAVALNDEAWEQWKNVAGETVPREVARSVFFGAVALHVAEAPAAYVGARRAGLDRPGKWATSTLLWGFPVILRLRKAKRLAAAG